MKNLMTCKRSGKKQDDRPLLTVLCSREISKSTRSDLTVALENLKKFSQRRQAYPAGDMPNVSSHRASILECKTIDEM
jgi:hypothetical protein